VLTVIVLPRFAAILGDMGQSLPRTTVLVLDAASLARAMLVPAIVTGMVLLVAWHLWTSTEDGRRRWHSMLLATPLLGPVRLATGTGRGCAALAALLDNGLPLASALPLAGRATGDVALARRFSDARQLLMRGSSLGHALRDSMSVSETAIRLARAGEESGRLASMIGHAAHLERTRATRLTQTAVRIIEPLLIVFFGGAVAIVAGALLQAVYSVRPT
jgi:type II secretory pathway component PulF